LLWQPNDRVSVSLKYENFVKLETPQLMQKPGYNTQVGLVPTAADPNRSGVDVPGLPNTWNSMAYSDFRRSETNGVSAWLDFKANDRWNLRFGYSHQTYKVDALFSGNLGMANNTTLLQGRRVRRQIYTNLDDTYETQATGKYHFGDTSLRLLFGAQYSGRRFDNWAGPAPNDPALGAVPTASPLPLWDLSDPSTWNRNATVPLSTLTANRTDATTDSVDKSLYGGTTFGFFNDRLLLLAGLRRTSTESQLTNHLTGQSQPKINASAITPQYGILYKLTPDVSAFVSYAESFVPGTQMLKNTDGTLKAAEPTKGHGYDLGFKADMLEGRLSGTLTFFDIRNKNIVNDLAVTDAFGNVTIYNVQSGEQRSRGIELDMTAALRDNWQLYFSYSYMDARIVDFTGNDAAILAQNPATLVDPVAKATYKNVQRFHNAPLQMSAPHMANLWTRYNFTQEGMQGVYVGGGFNFVRDQTLLSDTPESARQTYTLVNAMVGYAWTSQGRRMSVDFMGKNLADERYRPSQSTRSRPREFLLTFSASF
jgi:iron complex outermembrane receptor protein